MQGLKVRLVKLLFRAKREGSMRIIFKDKKIAREAAKQLSKMGLSVALNEVLKNSNRTMRFWQLRYTDATCMSIKVNDTAVMR